MENITSVRNIFPRQLTEEYDKVILDEVSKTLGEIKTDINYLKKGQEDLTTKLDAIEARQIKVDTTKALFTKAATVFWSVLLLVIAAYIGTVIH